MKKLSLNCLICLGVILTGSCSIILSAQTSSARLSERKNEIPKADLDAIQQAALDYIEGWYEGDTMRMNRSLHPDLIKRMIEVSQVQNMTKSQLVANTRHSRINGMKWDVKIFDVYKNIACVKVDSTDYMDYLQVGKIQGKWVIINVLWAPKK